jgi:hypothetical protein
MILGKAQAGKAIWILDDSQNNQHVHDIVSGLAAASGCNRKEVNAIKTLTNTFNLAVVWLLFEWCFFQNDMA